MSEETTTKVYVNGWSYNTGGGFDWYYKPEHADAAHEKEKAIAAEPKMQEENWTAYRFDVEVADTSDADQVTDEVAKVFYTEIDV